MTKEEAKEILCYMRMAFLPEGYIEEAIPTRSISDQQVSDALKIAIENLRESDITYDPLERSVI